MLTFFILTMVTLLDLVSGRYPRSLTDSDIAMGIIISGLEFLNFCGLPNNRYSKYVRTLDENSIFGKVISKNEKQAREIRFITFILTSALVITMSRVFRCSIIHWYYLTFALCINKDIACFLASQKERKQCWRELIKNGLALAVAVVVSLLVLYFFMDNIYSVFYRLIWSHLF